MIIKNT